MLRWTGPREVESPSGPAAQGSLIVAPANAVFSLCRFLYSGIGAALEDTPIPDGSADAKGPNVQSSWRLPTAVYVRTWGLAPAVR